ncbi:MAG TPA: hypothetical protein V6D50_25540 [Chroococcales cyanobacterium]|jgi:large exoprotein involved in heme utilization and adhesion
MAAIIIKIEVAPQPLAADSLGNEQTSISPDEVIRDVLSNHIEGGARLGANLFHSFREFQVDAGRGVYCTDPGGDKILGRVTGSVVSEILGTLGAWVVIQICSKASFISQQFYCFTYFPLI